MDGFLLLWIMVGFILVVTVTVSGDGPSGIFKTFFWVLLWPLVLPIVFVAHISSNRKNNKTNKIMSSQNQRPPNTGEQLIQEFSELLRDLGKTFSPAEERKLSKSDFVSLQRLATLARK